MDDDIKIKANLCSSCTTKPCQVGCPLNNDITGFIKYIKENKYKEAFDLLSKTTVMPALCGVICPKDKQCYSTCIKRNSSTPVEIGELESYVGNLAIINKWKLKSPKKTNKHVLVIGGGPAGLTCTAFLRQNGVGVSIYEKHDYLGGLLTHGIPDFRLSKDLVNKVIQKILDLKIDVKYNQELGKDFNLNDVINQYDAIFLGIGANISNNLNIKGEHLPFVYGGNELLENNIKLDLNKKTVVVIGGGNVAIDVSRTLKYQGAKKVIVIYRKNPKDMKAFKEDILKAKKESIKFIFKTKVIKILDRKKIKKVEVIKTKVFRNKNGKQIVLNIKDSNYQIGCDYVIKAIGSHSDINILKKLNINLNNQGKIIIDSVGHTSNNKIFAGGDVSLTKSTVAFASRAGRNAAYEILNYLKKTQ